MAIIQQNSRISHHTLTSIGATFSVPSQEDFTSKTSPWTPNDLCLSEIGVNEGDGRVYIRIGNGIKEFDFKGPTGSGGENLANTLAVGNTMSGFIQSSGGDTQLYITDSDSYLETNISGDFAGLYLDPQYNNLGTALVRSDGTSQTLLQIEPDLFNLEIGNPVGSVVKKTKSAALSTTASGTYSLATIPLNGFNNATFVEATIVGYSPTLTGAYYGKLTGLFQQDSLTWYATSTYDLLEKNSITGATSELITDGTDIFINVRGTIQTIRWQVMYEYITTI